MKAVPFPLFIQQDNFIPYIDSDILIAIVFVLLIILIYLYWGSIVRFFIILKYSIRLTYACTWMIYAMYKLQKLRKQQSHTVKRLKAVQNNIQTRHENAGAISKASAAVIKKNLDFWREKEKFHFDMERHLTYRIEKLNIQWHEVLLLYKSLVKVVYESRPDFGANSAYSRVKKMVSSPATQTLAKWQKKLTTTQREAYLAEARRTFEQIVKI